ncbi:MAG: non-heme iron oxygenase ferredoxin subunit [Blastocatellia bacterium]|nr:non-heme iron oxygenase ferredoxin subunit [Blastocatellia bacterium]MCS7156273.1 non-heme iron oxygenase ferredoxin subunit [Blastocatellia bacterium]MCX7751377.1 non-heme iron oxygenase ferredoxin subunit [Blastocatellia bacterium]MDW8169090.1 non-heme iron oxygenase ferredoxin subunit [Acidobacteriota bacterium]MDW8255794.1 non-heme iron oxygenase ferredoxin subunit [Acidobacteriota bacterium]
MGQFVKVARVSEVAPGEARLVEIEGRRIALFNLNGTFHAIDDVCPHRGGPLSEGTLEGEIVVCPWHGARFRISTGEVLSPPATHGVTCYPVRVQGEDIEIEV